MNTYVTAASIRSLREAKRMTQAELAEKLGVTGKAVSRWETAKGLPDISLLEPLAAALGVSVNELMDGKQIVNRNKASNIRRMKFYVCPICGNVIYSMGEAMISCCGVTLPVLEADEPDEAHLCSIERVEDEFFITVRHGMEKTHYISFAAMVTFDRMQMVKLYPEGNAEVRFPARRGATLYYCCSRHGLMKQKL